MYTLVIASCAVLLYLVATVLMVQRLRQRLTHPIPKWQIMSVGAFAALMHAAILGRMLITDAGLDLGLFNAISLISWLITCLFLLSTLKQPTENLALFIFPTTALAIILESSFHGSGVSQHWDSSLEIHILISIISYSLLSIAALQAILLAVQDKHLREKRPGGFIRSLPPLQTMESLLFQMIAVGFAMQTLSLITGLMFVENMLAQHLVHKTVLSLIAWLFFGVLLWGRWRFGWRGRTAIRWTLSGFIALALSYLGSKTVLELILGRA